MAVRPDRDSLANGAAVEILAIDVLEHLPRTDMAPTLTGDPRCLSVCFVEPAVEVRSG